MPILEIEPGPGPGTVPLIRRLRPRTEVIAVNFGELPDATDPFDAPAHWPAAGARFSWGDAEIARRLGQRTEAAARPVGSRGALRTISPTFFRP